MAIISGPKPGTVMRWLAKSTRPKLIPRPIRAVRRGRPIATTDPKAISMMMMAARIPIASLEPGEACTASEMGLPPRATANPGWAKPWATLITRCV